eukprot:TCALIF_10570-PA protein Name:"Similar to FR FMRFamide receptor (Drosophila melanogaster)" AED:0.25 eAED:0.23 QI:0/0.5/0/0.6/1/1/5/0/605
MGNLISLVVLTTIDKRNSFNVLLVVLAITDSVLIMFYLVDTCYIDGILQPKLPYPSWYVSLFPKFLHPVKHIAMSACIYMILAIAFNRYQAICNPMLYRPKAFVSFLIVVLIAVSTNLARFYEFESIQEDNSTYLVTTILNENPNFVVFNSNFELFTTGLIPLFALCFYNFMIYMQIRKSNFIKGRFVGSRMRSQSNQTNSDLGGGIEMDALGREIGSTGHNKRIIPPQISSYRNLREAECAPFLQHPMEKRGNARGIQFLRTSSSPTSCSSVRDPKSRAFLGSLIRPFSPPSHNQDPSHQCHPNCPFYLEHAAPSMMSRGRGREGGRQGGGHRTGPKDLFSSVSSSYPPRQFSVSNGGSRKLLKRSSSGSSNSTRESLRHGTSGSRTRTSLGPRRSLEGNHLTHPPHSMKAASTAASGTSALGHPLSSSPPSPSPCHPHALPPPSPPPPLPPLVHAMNQKKRSSFRGPIRKTAQPYRRKTEKSTAILLGIILVFISCHVLRFSIQLYEVFAQGNGVHRHYKYCEKLGKLHTPLAMPILASVSHLLIIVNSSVNVLIYYCCGDRFRRGLCRLLEHFHSACLAVFWPQQARTRNELKRFNSFSDFK